MSLYDGPKESCYSTDFFCYGNKIFVTQKSFFAAVIKFLLRKKDFSASCFSSASIFCFFYYFDLQPCFFFLLKLFCFNFSFLVFISFIFATQFFCFKCCFLFLFKALKLSCYWFFFYYLSLCYIDFGFSFQYVYQFFCLFFCCSAHFFPFYIFLCFCFLLLLNFPQHHLCVLVTFCFSHLFCWPGSFGLYYWCKCTWIKVVTEKAIDF